MLLEERHRASGSKGKKKNRIDNLNNGLGFSENNAGQKTQKRVLKRRGTETKREAAHIQLATDEEAGSYELCSPAIGKPLSYA